MKAQYQSTCRSALLLLFLAGLMLRYLNIINNQSFAGLIFLILLAELLLLILFKIHRRFLLQYHREVFEEHKRKGMQYYFIDYLGRCHQIDEIEWLDLLPTRVLEIHTGNDNTFEVIAH